MKFIAVIFVFLCIQSAQSQLIDLSIQSLDEYPICVKDIIKTSDNNLLIGIDNSYSRTSIVKMSHEGIIEWAKMLDVPGISEVHSYEVSQKSNGNYYLHGLLSEPVGQSAILLEITSSGALLIAKKYFLSAEGAYTRNKMTIASNGDLIFLTSQYDHTAIFRTDSDGNMLWGKRFFSNSGGGKNPGFDLTVFPDGSMMVCGKNESSLSIIKLLSDGSVQFMKNHFVGQYTHAKAIQLIPGGNIIISGETFDNSNAGFVYLMEVNSATGDINWIKTVDNIEPYFAEHSVTVNDGKITTTFAGADAQTFTSYQYFIEYDLAGNITNSRILDSALYNGQYSHVKIVNSNLLVYGGVRVNNETNFGYAYEIDNLSNAHCLLSLRSFTNSVFTDYSEDISSSTSVVPFTDEDSLIVTFLDTSYITSTMCSLLSTYEEQDLYEKIMVHPNPSNGLFQFKNLVINSSLEIRDINGKLVYSDNVLYINPTIDLSSYESGVYFYSVTSKNAIQTGKIVLE